MPAVRPLELEIPVLSYHIIFPIKKTHRSCCVIEECKSPGTAPSNRQVPVPLQLAPSTVVPQSHDELGPSASSPFDAGFFNDLVADYVARVLPVLPIIGEPEFRSAISRLDGSRDDCVLVHALGAITMNMARVGPRHSLDGDSDQVKPLYTTALELRGPVMPQDPLTVQSIMIPFVSSICLLAHHRHIDMGFYYLHEAITRIQIRRVDEPDNMTLLDVGERARRERLY